MKDKFKSYTKKWKDMIMGKAGKGHMVANNNDEPIKSKKGRKLQKECYKSYQDYLISLQGSKDER